SSRSGTITEPSAWSRLRPVEEGSTPLTSSVKLKLFTAAVFAAVPATMVFASGAAAPPPPPQPVTAADATRRAAPAPMKEPVLTSARAHDDTQPSGVQPREPLPDGSSPRTGVMMRLAG